MRTLLLILAFVWLASAWLLCDQVSLRNGDRLSGTIVKSDGKTLILHTDYAGDIELKWHAVEGIQSGEPLYVEGVGGKTVSGTVTTSRDRLEVSSGSAAPVEVPLADVKTIRGQSEQAAYEKSLHPGLLGGWQTGLNAGLSLTGGNSRTRSLSLGFTGMRQGLKDKLGLYANAVYARNDAPGATPAVTANTEAGGLRYDHDLRKRVFGFVGADFHADALQGLNLRSVFDGGLGYHAWKSDRTTLDLLAGLDYTHESYTTLTRNYPALALGEELTHKIGKSTVINQRLGFFPDLSSAGDFRGTFDFATVTKMTKHLGWQNSFSDVYVTNPPLGKKQNDLIFTSGLNLAFGQ